MLVAVFACLVVRAVFAGLGFDGWFSTHSIFNLRDEGALIIPLRWTVGLISPFILSVLAWRNAKIHSTQSATGILYVVVIVCFIGEVMADVLLASTGYSL